MGNFATQSLPRLVNKEIPCMMISRNHALKGDPEQWHTQMRKSVSDGGNPPSNVYIKNSVVPADLNFNCSQFSAKSSQQGAQHEAEFAGHKIHIVTSSYPSYGYTAVF